MLHPGTNRACVESNKDGFVVVRRKNNPLRDFAVVHKLMGKIGGVHPLEIVNLVKEMSKLVTPVKGSPIIGLSESSILLGRVLSEILAEPFVFSTRYPVPGMMNFSELHSHAPAQYLIPFLLRQSNALCIVEDEVTTGNTAMNLVRALSGEMPGLCDVEMIALKGFISPERFTEMQKCAESMGIKFSLHFLYQEACNNNEPLNICESSEPTDNSAFDFLISEIEKGRGRIDVFSPQQAFLRYEMWERVLAGLDLSQFITVIGASEAIDLAFDISYILYLKGYDTCFRHLTISPWELPCWSFHTPQSRSMYLYMPPSKADKGDTYILVYDQPFQESQVRELAVKLRKMGARVYILNNIEGDIHFINVEA